MLNCLQSNRRQDSLFSTCKKKKKKKRNTQTTKMSSFQGLLRITKLLVSRKHIMEMYLQTFPLEAIDDQ